MLGYIRVQNRSFSLTLWNLLPSCCCFLVKRLSVPHVMLSHSLLFGLLSSTRNKECLEGRDVMSFVALFSMTSMVLGLSWMLSNICGISGWILPVLACHFYLNAPIFTVSWKMKSRVCAKLDTQWKCDWDFKWNFENVYIYLVINDLNI